MSPRSTLHLQRVQSLHSTLCLLSTVSTPLLSIYTKIKYRIRETEKISSVDTAWTLEFHKPILEVKKNVSSGGVLIADQRGRALARVSPPSGLHPSRSLIFPSTCS